MNYCSCLMGCFLSFLTALSSKGQSVNPAFVNHSWKASWIAVPEESPEGYGVYLFRKSFFLTEAPDSFVIHVSADNRYKLFVNEKQASLGPARGDLEHWNFETLDIGKLLHKGINIIVAQVWNEGEWRAEGQISLRTGFILQSDDSSGMAVNTDKTWKCVREKEIHPLPFDIQTYYVAGPGELVDLRESTVEWGKSDFNDSAWKNALVLMQGMPVSQQGGYGTVPGWLLKPSNIPAMEYIPQRLFRVVQSAGVEIPAGFPSQQTDIGVPAHTEAFLLLDQGFLTNAYPAIYFSQGKEASISLSYAEALYSHYPIKGNRDETDGKIFIGRKDSIISNGGLQQSFTSLSFRTYRYLLVRVKTLNDPLVIKDITGMATGYPFQWNAQLSCERKEINRMLEIGWRTARLCAMETYMDCPYYEQLQYIGDTRIQAMISLYNSGDERLLRNAMNQMDESRRPEGVTLSRHPSHTPQYIPTFSLLYIGMLHDYMMYGRDSVFVKNKLSGERQILQYFKNFQRADGSLAGVPHWMFTDWVTAPAWTSGVGPVGADGSSSLLDLQLLWAYQLAADLESRYGMSSYALTYRGQADRLKKTIQNKYWDKNRQWYADRPEKDLFSQHANSLAILTDIVPKDKMGSMAKRMLSDSSLAPASIYFKYYLHQALVKAGMGNDYLNWLDQWRENIDRGMTTWAEISDIDNARSDCHAWGSSPNIEFFRTVLGIDSDAPGFSRVKIEPHLGSLKNIGGTIPHPQGKISASYHWINGIWNIHIELPAHTTGELIWQGASYPLQAGSVNNFQIPSPV